MMQDNALFIWLRKFLPANKIENYKSYKHGNLSHLKNNIFSYRNYPLSVTTRSLLVIMLATDFFISIRMMDRVHVLHLYSAAGVMCG